jgi:hypothetical protein
MPLELVVDALKKGQAAALFQELIEISAKTEGKGTLM